MGVNSSLRGRDAPLASGCSPSTLPSFALSHTGLSNTPWKYVAPNSTFPRPDLSWVWTRPPSLSPASKTRTLRSRSASTSALAAARPANPPPITTTVGILQSLADEERWPRSKQQIHSSLGLCKSQVRVQKGLSRADTFRARLPDAASACPLITSNTASTRRVLSVRQVAVAMYAVQNHLMRWPQMACPRGSATWLDPVIWPAGKIGPKYDVMQRAVPEQEAGGTHRLKFQYAEV